MHESWYKKLAGRKVKCVIGKSGNGPEGRNFFDEKGIVTSGRVGKDGGIIFADGVLATVARKVSAELIDPKFYEQVGGVMSSTTIEVKKGRVNVRNDGLKLGRETESPEIN